MLAIHSATARYPKAIVGRQNSPSSILNSSPASSKNAITTRPQGALTQQQSRAFHVSLIAAAVPKKKQSYSRVRVRTHSQNRQIRMSDWSHRHACTHCGKDILRHNVCHHCGWYKGVPIFLRAVKRNESRLEKAALKKQQEAASQTPPSL